MNSLNLLTPAEVMAMLKYKDRKAFMRMARSKGLPRAMLNRRVIRFERHALEAWLRRRSA